MSEHVKKLASIKIGREWDWGYTTIKYTYTCEQPGEKTSLQRMSVAHNLITVQERYVQHISGTDKPGMSPSTNRKIIQVPLNEK